MCRDERSRPRPGMVHDASVYEPHELGARVQKVKNCTTSALTRSAPVVLKAMGPPFPPKSSSPWPNDAIMTSSASRTVHTIAHENSELTAVL